MNRFFFALLAGGAFTVSAKVVFNEDFEHDLSKWDKVKTVSQRSFSGKAFSGKKALRIDFAPGSSRKFSGNHALRSKAFPAKPGVYRISAKVLLLENYGGVINVADESHELEFTTQLTLNGTLYKEGAGTLVMGGSVKFAADASDTPVEGANLFIVTNGTVKVTAADAMNGLATTFAAGTRLVLEVDPDNAELIGNGIRNDKTDNPFSVNGGGKLPISLYASDDVKAAMKGRPVTIGLFTVTAKADETFRTLMPETLRSPFKSTKSSIVRSEKDGTVVYSLNIVPVGFHMIVR